MGRLAGLALVVVVVGCAGTYYDTTDRYATGMRWFDRGGDAEAIQSWKPLAEAGDCDGQYRYGTLFALGAGARRSRSRRSVPTKR